MTSGTNLSCEDATLALGAYVVGALDPRERADVEAHLGRCPACRDELAQLAPLPGLLSRLTVDEAVAGVPTPDEALLSRLLAAAEREQRATGRRRWLAAAAAVVVLAGGAGAGVAGWNAAHDPHWQQVSATAHGVRMTVDVEPAASGTALALHLTGVPSGERCRLVAVSRTGTRDVAGSWEATYEGTATIKGMTSLTRAQLARLVIETYDGRTLVAADVPSA